MEYHVRSARLTDVDAAIRILMRDPADPDQQRQDADRLRNLLFVPSATVVVAEAERRVIGIGVLSIRPAVRSGPFIGVIDELGVAGPQRTVGERRAGSRRRAAQGVGCSILEHLVTSARNKGCTRVDVTDPLASRRAGAPEACRVRATRGAAEPRHRLNVQTMGAPGRDTATPTASDINQQEKSSP